MSGRRLLIEDDDDGGRGSTMIKMRVVFVSFFDLATAATPAVRVSICSCLLLARLYAITATVTGNSSRGFNYTYMAP